MLRTGWHPAGIRTSDLRTRSYEFSYEASIPSTTLIRVSAPGPVQAMKPRISTNNATFLSSIDTLAANYNAIDSKSPLGFAGIARAWKFAEDLGSQKFL